MVFALLLLQCAVHSHRASLSPPNNCKLGIAGAGPAGIYSAWRLSTGGSDDLQGTKRDLTVELGAYRFCGATNHSSHGCEMYMPLIASLVQNGLKLPVKTYEPVGNEHGMVKIVDDHGENAGLLTYVEKMYSAAVNAGVRIFYGYHLDNITVSPQQKGKFTFNLTFANGATVTTSQILLNLPLQPALRVLQASRRALRPYYDGGRFPMFLRVPEVIRHVKFYVHYDWAWWRALGLTSGDFRFYSQDGVCRFATCPCAQQLPLQGRYHDGHVKCDGDGGPEDHSCRGYIEVTYTSDGVQPSNVSWFQTFALEMDAPQSGAPVQQFEADDYLVEQAHKTLLAVHAAQLASANLTAAVTAATPTGAWLSMWDHKSPGFGAGTHMMSVGPINGGHYGPGAEAGSVPALAMHPMSALPLFIANEAFHPSDWAEGALEMAENVVARHFGLSRPEWITPENYEMILFTDSNSTPQPPNATTTPCPPGEKCVCGSVYVGPVIPGKVTLSAPHPAIFTAVAFASYGTPKGKCGAFEVDSGCDEKGAMAAVAALCVGKSSCTITADIGHMGGRDPCPGVPKHLDVQLTYGTGAPKPSPSPPPPPPHPPGTKDPWVMAAPFTGFLNDTNRSIDLTSIAPLAKKMAADWGINTVWVMGNRGQWDTLSRDDRMAVAEEWVVQGHKYGLRILVHCGTEVMSDARAIAAHAEAVGADGIGSIAPAIELAHSTSRVFNFVKLVGAAAPKTPFYYYHTNQWNGVTLNNVDMDDFFALNIDNAFPTLAGVKFESYSMSEWNRTWTNWRNKYTLLWAGNIMQPLSANQPGQGGYVACFGGPSWRRTYRAWQGGDIATANEEWSKFGKLAQASGGNFVERYLYPHFCEGCHFGPARWPEPLESEARIQAAIDSGMAVGLFNQSWHPDHV